MVDAARDVAEEAFGFKDDQRIEIIEPKLIPSYEEEKDVLFIVDEAVKHLMSGKLSFNVDGKINGLFSLGIAGGPKALFGSGNWSESTETVINKIYGQGTPII